MEILSVEETELGHVILVESNNVQLYLLRPQIGKWITYNKNKIGGFPVDHRTSAELEQLFVEYNETKIPDVFVEYLAKIEI